MLIVLSKKQSTLIYAIFSEIKVRFELKDLVG